MMTKQGAKQRDDDRAGGKQKDDDQAGSKTEGWWQNWGQMEGWWQGGGVGHGGDGVADGGSVNEKYSWTGQVLEIGFW